MEGLQITPTGLARSTCFAVSVIGADDYLRDPARQGRVRELVSVHCQQNCCSCDASVVPVPLQACRVIDFAQRVL